MIKDHNWEVIKKINCIKIVKIFLWKISKEEFNAQTLKNIYIWMSIIINEFLFSGLNGQKIYIFATDSSDIFTNNLYPSIFYHLARRLYSLNWFLNYKFLLYIS